MGKTMLFGTAALLASSVAMAGEMPNGAISGYILNQEIEVGPGEVDDNGFGIKGWHGLTPNIFAAYEYQSVSGDIDNDYYRVGGGFWQPLGEGVGFWVNAEYVDFDGPDGFGVHVGGHSQISEAVGLYGSVGFLDIEDDTPGNRFEDDGAEFLLGAEFGVLPGLSVFGEYRSFDGDLFTVNELHAGINWYY